ncbi:MAG TPA: hypothetical protein VNQ73_04550 [Ilumatobacter sp.]|nr:hypothetical protein [Ilumatobacter sp.]
MVDAPFTISPAPTDEEAAAIAAAVTSMWPQPAVPVRAEGPRSLGWRFSGRWWRRDRHATAERPWS